MKNDPDARRLDEVETRLTYQERTIEILNQTVTAQWQQIDRLTRQLDELKLRLGEIETQAQGAAPRDPLPPHY